MLSGSLLKLVGRGKGMQRLLWTFVKSFQSLPWVAVLIGLVFFIYGVLGMQIFANLGYTSDGVINRNNNFRTFFASLLVLFRTATGEEWQQIMEYCVTGQLFRTVSARLGTISYAHSARVYPQGREPCDGPNEFCGTWFAVPYFVSFVMLVTFLVLNLFIAVIMDNFDYLTDDPAHLGEQDLGRFTDLWAEYDPDGTGYIHHSDLVRLLRQEPPPLGFGLKCPEERVLCKMIRLNVAADDHGMVHFNTSLLALLRVNLGIYSDSAAGPWETRQRELRAMIAKIYLPDAAVLDTMLPDPATIKLATGALYAALLLQKKYRTARVERLLAQARNDQKRMTLDAGEATELRQPLVLKRTLSSDVSQRKREKDHGTELIHREPKSRM